MDQNRQKKIYLETFKMASYDNRHYEIFVSSMHGNGAGLYNIENVNVDNYKVEIRLDFVVGDFEVGSSVINQRVLFFLMNKNCGLAQVKIN